MTAAPRRTRETAIAQTHCTPPTDVYGFVPRRAATDASLGAPALRLLIVMSAHADGSTRRCYAAQSTLADDLGWSSGDYSDTRRVRRYLPDLLEACLIREDGRHVWADGRWTDQYLIAPFPQVDSDVVSPSDDSDVTSPSEVDVAAIAASAFATRRPADSDITSVTKVTPRHDKQTPASEPFIKPLTARIRSRDEMEKFYKQRLDEEEARRARADAS